MYTVGELAKMAGVSARTLRYYDREGLLKPSAVTEAGYRLYGADAPSQLCSFGSWIFPSTISARFAPARITTRSRL